MRPLPGSKGSCVYLAGLAVALWGLPVLVAGADGHKHDGESGYKVSKGDAKPRSEEEIDKDFEQVREQMKKEKDLWNGEGKLSKKGERAFGLIDAASKMEPLEDREAALHRFQHVREIKQKMDELGHSNAPGAQRELQQLGHELREQLHGLREYPTISKAWGDGGDRRTLSPAAYDAMSGIAGRHPWFDKEKTQAHLDRGQKQEALANAQDSAQTFPRSAIAQVALGHAKAEYGDLQGAAEAGKRALELEPGNFEAHSLVKNYGGRSNQRAGEPTKESRTVEVSRERPVGFSRDLALASSELSGGRASEHSSQSSVQLAVAAETLLQKKQFAPAAKAAAEAIRRDPENVRAHVARTLAHLQGRQYPAAVEAATAGLRLSPDNHVLLWARASAYNRLQQYDLALEDAEKAIAADPDSARAYVQKAVALDGLGGRREEVKAALNKAAGIDPSNRKFLTAYLDMADGEFAAEFLGHRAPSREIARKAPAGFFDSADNRFVVIGLSSLVGGFLIAMGLLQNISREWKDKIRNIFQLITRRSPKVKDLPEGGGAVLGVNGANKLVGTYQVRRQIGSGGMGVVYEGFDTSLQRKVAIKKMREEIRCDPRERERFLKEARLVANMRHPNIVEIYSILEEDKDAYLIFEFVDGQTVSELLFLRKTLSFHEAVGVMKGACRALDYAHSKKIIHRDLKPSNIMISTDREVKVMDFGVAREAKESITRLSMTNTIVGTPPYMAPEQEQGMVRKASDVFALSVLLYEMVTGHLPFQGIGAGMLMAKMNKTYVPASRIVSGLPSGFDEVTDRALDPEPDKRWPTAGDFYKNLESLASVR